MDKLIPWKQLEKKVARYYPKGQTGRPPYALLTMLRVHCRQLFYGTSRNERLPEFYERIYRLRLPVDTLGNEELQAQLISMNSFSILQMKFTHAECQEIGMIKNLIRG